MSNDLQKLIKKIANFHFAYSDAGIEQPLFRLTISEYWLLISHLINICHPYHVFYPGELPRYLGVDFEILGDPIILKKDNKIKNDLGLTQKQIDEICNRIGLWYLHWKNRIANFDERTHQLGFAKEQLKVLICGDE